MQHEKLDGFDFTTKKGNRIRHTGNELNEATGQWDMWIKNLETREFARVTKEQFAAMIVPEQDSTPVTAPVPAQPVARMVRPQQFTQSNLKL